MEGEIKRGKERQREREGREGDTKSIAKQSQCGDSVQNRMSEYM